MNSKLNILRNISSRGKSINYLEEEQEELVNLTLEDYKKIIDEYIVENEMIYVIVGDKKTQLDKINELGKGKAIELDIYGDRK